VILVVDFEIASRLMQAFPCSFINYAGEIIVHREANQYFILRDCQTELDVKCKVLEWLSRAAYKTDPFGTKKNAQFHKFMLDGINKFLGTSFTYKDIDLIYTYLGNACNHARTIRFIESGYDMKVLKEREPK
jgi:hypothetical protein